MPTSTAEINAAEVVRLRSSVPLTQSELAQRMSVSSHSIWKIEKGKTKNPRPATIRRLAEALGVTPADITVKVAS